MNKATKIFGIIRRAYLNLNEENFIPLYKALVRSHLDFASAVWSPYKQKHKDLIENVQRRATKQIPSLKDLTYEERLRKLKLPSLSYRRIHGDMIELYKVVHEKYYKKAAPELSLRKDVAREAPRGHEFTLYQKRYNKLLRKNSFTIRAVPLWNSLPNEVVTAQDTNTFKRRLDKFWKNEEILYNYKAPLPGTGRHDNTQGRSTTLDLTIEA